MSSDAQPSQSRNYPTELGALGGAIALWAALCAVAATEAGALVGYFIGFGVAMLSLPLAMLGAIALMPVIIICCLGLGGIIGVTYVAIGLWKPNMRPLAVRGVHFIGFVAALMLCMRGLSDAF